MNGSQTYPHPPHAVGERSLSTLLRDLFSQASALLRHEVELAKTEVSEKVDQALRYASFVAIGGGLMLVALVVLMTAVNRGVTALLTLMVPPEIAIWLGPLFLALTLGLVGGLFIKVGIDRLRNVSLRPHITQETLEENTEWLKEKIG